jgi:hypothetical protein
VIISDICDYFDICYIWDYLGLFVIIVCCAVFTVSQPLLIEPYHFCCCSGYPITALSYCINRLYNRAIDLGAIEYLKEVKFD